MTRLPSVARKMPTFAATRLLPTPPLPPPIATTRGVIHAGAYRPLPRRSSTVRALRWSGRFRRNSHLIEPNSGLAVPHAQDVSALGQREGLGRIVVPVPDVVDAHRRDGGRLDCPVEAIPQRVVVSARRPDPDVHVIGAVARNCDR